MSELVATTTGMPQDPRDPREPRDSLQFIVNHVILPPKLPEKADDPQSSREDECHLIELLSAQLESYCRKIERKSSTLCTAWAIIQAMLDRCAKLISTPSLDTEVIVRTFTSLKESDKPSVLLIHIRAQNAVLILRRGEESVVVECFEASPLAEAVMACNGALIRSFPAHAVSIPFEVFDDEGFQQQLADKICRLDVENVEEMMHKSHRTRESNTQIRDTTNPRLITEMLMAILAALGTPAQVQQIQKRTRDDVIGNKCLLPWRRSPLWLALRVTIQSTLAGILPNKEATVEYKNFMIYFFIEIASQSHNLELPDEMCRVILGKIARRSSKLGSETHDFVRERALTICSVVDSMQKQKWKQVCDQDGQRPTTIDKEAFDPDTSLSLPTSRKHINAILEDNKDMLEAQHLFSPSCKKWLTSSRGLPTLNMVASATQQEKLLILAEFEAWISNSLPHWTQQRLEKPNAKDCVTLAELATSYRDVALPMYDGTPEQMSTMLLIIAELWQSLDQLTLSLLPLLRDFSPSLSLDLFAPLLLPKKNQMRRLWTVELHIDAREAQAKPTNPSIFSDPVDNCFNVQLFGLSKRHKTLMKCIEDEASAKRTAKEKEWKESSERYHQLKQDAKATPCQTAPDESGEEIHDPQDCEKCTLDREADTMVIEVHEWPLPVDANFAKSAVVELDCRLDFAAWRNLTWMLIHDLGRQSPICGEGPKARLCSYAGLQEYYRDMKSRLTLASSTKPFAQAQQHLLKFPVPLDSCFANNELQYKLFDPLKGCWIKDQVEIPSFHAACVTPLPEGPYFNLQYTVDSVSHSQNEVIANQDDCSSVLSLPEYLSFGSLRADGERIQWYNIRREMAASNLNFNTEAVCTLVTQAAWQAGSRGDSDLRNAHVDLQDPSFCVELLAIVGRVLESISANWKSDHTMLSLITLVLRVSSLSSDQSVVSEALDLLKRMRAVARDWTSILAATSGSCAEPEQISNRQQRLSKAAILCKMTYEVDDPSHLGVMNSPDDLCTWVECCIHVRNSSPGEETLLPPDLRRLRLRDTKLSHSFQNIISKLPNETLSHGLDLAISKQWSGFHPGPDPWKAFDPPNNRWMVRETTTASKQHPYQVCYNMLEGELLVDGKPLGRLPADYIRNETYVRLFGAQTFRVFPSDMPGMSYMSVQEIDGYVMHFGIRAGQIVIRMHKGLQTLELIPHDRFVKELPIAFVDDYVHWLDIRSHAIELRPLAQRWRSDSGNWQLRYQPKGASSLLLRNKKLVDIRSKTCEKIMGVFGALELAEHVHVMLTNDQCLEVALPRYDLHFFLNDSDEFQCYELDRIVDPDQSVGTLIGLENRLVLCGIQPLARKHNRIILIPEGHVTITKNSTHTIATIGVQSPEIRLFRYQIDASLRRLKGDGDLFSTIYMAYLHAVTSNILPDPLTECTGTEEAISLLRQRSLCLTKPPGKRMLDLLKKIAALTPRREFFPHHLKVMQQIKWHKSLSMLSQHDSFLTLTAHIISSGDRYLAFYPETQLAESLKSRNAHLLERAKIRNSCFWSSDFGGGVKLRTYDSVYESRDCLIEVDRGARSYEIALLVHEWPAELEVSEDITTDLSSYGVVTGFGERFNAAKPFSQLLTTRFSESWAPLHSVCRTSSQDRDTYHLLFLFAIIAYGKTKFPLTALRTLLAFAFIPMLRKPSIPADVSRIELSKGIFFDNDALRRIIIRQMNKYRDLGKQSDKALLKADRERYDAVSREQAQAVINAYRQQWPCKNPKTPPQSLSSHLKWEPAHQAISHLFCTWTANKKYATYLGRIQAILNRIYEESSIVVYRSAEWHLVQKSQPMSWSVSLPSLPNLMSVLVPASSSRPDVLKVARTLKPAEKNEKLRALIADIRSQSLGDNNHLLRKQYRDDLLASYDTFSNHQEQMALKYLPLQLTEIVLNRLTCESDVRGILEAIRNVLGAKNPESTLLELAGLWPRLTIRALLINLSTRPSTSLTQAWKECILVLGESLTLLQRARRLVLTGERNEVSNFCVEAENEGHQNWSTQERPDWLLIELEGDFLIRPIQARVALEMVQPSSSTNSLVQLNMGEGKSSVIVPLVAVAIANGERLSRIIVLKSLSKQMRDTFSQRLGGIVDRPIYFMPFSRKVQVNESIVTQMQELYQSCLDSGGILLAHPEHVLSFKLMGIERLTSGDVGVTPQLIKSQQWLDINARDTLDESDELLDVKFQLIYTLGTQRMMDGQPDRWLIVQGIFDLVQKHALCLQEEQPGEIETVFRSNSSFPMIILLSQRIDRELVARIASDVVDNYLPGLDFQYCPPGATSAVLNFIRDRKVSVEDCQEVERSFGEQKAFIQKILLVRGFIACGILIFVLRNKRWSVNYGLDPTRCLSAVPYRAKGVPAPSAEFAQPDVAVALTCLSYYYNGLSEDQIRKSLELLQRSDDPSVEYLSWIRGCDQLPIDLRSWSAVNLEDDHQCYDILFPLLKYSKKLVDSFLSHVVFPKEGKEFDEKLSTSGWDLIGKQKPHLTTGFSGTNDNRFILPLSISQRDLPELQHTSGKVLSYVLRKENLLYHCARDDRGRQLSAEGLVSYIHRLDSTIRVVIDVGAQVLDTTNRDFIRAWMDAASDVDAGIFFDEDDNVMVLTRDLKLEKLAASSFQNRMDRCVVYLDEVHTRGTDLKLPATTRAAVTLGPRLTKDRLVQACMRLRKLAQGQSLMFLAPPEVHQSITELANKPEDQLDGYDVVAWSLEQSCQSIERSQPLRILQGLSYKQRQITMDEFSTTFPQLDDLAEGVDVSSEVIHRFREREEQRLHDLYAPVSLKDNVLPGIIQSSQKMSDPMVQELLAMWRALGSSDLEDATVHEEHEREVAQEVEQETQIERPPKAKALTRTVDPDLHDFITTGRLENFMKFSIVYDRVVKMTSAKLDSGSDPWPHLRVTKDFANTVERPQSGFYDDYLRPVNFVLTCKREVRPSFLLIISQYEANELFREIRDPTSCVRLQVYEPRVMKSMMAVDVDAEWVSRSVEDWQSLSSGIRRELNLFAGQVYLNSHKDYKKLSKDLGPRLNPSLEQTRSFVKAWIAIRRKGQDFLQSHIGQMVSGRVISEEAFE